MYSLSDNQKIEIDKIYNENKIQDWLYEKEKEDRSRRNESHLEIQARKKRIPKGRGEADTPYPYSSLSKFIL